MSSPELDVFRLFSTKIQAAVVSLDTFASILYSKNIINETVRNNATSMTGLGPEQKALDLVKAMQAKLKAVTDKERKRVFDLILQVMDENIPLDDVAEQMREAYKEEVAKAKLMKKKEKSSRDGPGVTDSDPAQIDRPPVMNALLAVDKKLGKNQRSRYHLAVVILMGGNQVATQEKGFLPMFDKVQKKFGSYPLAVAFTIEVLERSHWGDTEGLKPFASDGYVLDDSVELFLAINDYFDQKGEAFESIKVDISHSFLKSRDVIDLDRSEFVLLLFSQRVITSVDDAVSKIEGFLDSKSYEVFEERRKRSAPERSDTNPPTTGAGITPPSTNTVPTVSHVNGTNETTDPPRHRVKTDGPVGQETDIFEKIISDDDSIFEVFDDAKPASTIPDDGATSTDEAVLKIHKIFENVKVGCKEFSSDFAKNKNIMLMTATDTELRAVLGYLKPLGDQDEVIETVTPAEAGSERVYIGKYGQYPVVVGMSAQSKDRQGSSHAYSATRNIMRAFKPRFIIGIGICYSVDIEKFPYCDVAVASKVCNLTSIRVGEDKWEARNGTFSTGDILLKAFWPPTGFQLFRPDGNNKKQVRVRCGTIISRADLVDKLDYKEALKKLAGPNAIGGEMEGAGIMAAIENPPYDRNVQAIIIKAFSDNADGKKDKDRHWKDYAADAVARYVHHQMDKKNGALL